jgi:large conductance mechanosensitive channel protein
MLEMNDNEKELINQIVLDKIGDELDAKFKEWKTFAFKNQTIDAIIAFTLGIAFSKLVTSFSESLIMPLVQFLSKYTGESWRQVVWEPFPNLKFELGQLYAATVDFIIMSIILFGLWKFMKFFTKSEKPKESCEDQCQSACCVKKN